MYEMLLNYEGAAFDYIDQRVIESNELLLLPDVVANDVVANDAFANERFRDPDGPLPLPTMDTTPPCPECRGGGTIETTDQHGLAKLAVCPICGGDGRVEERATVEPESQHDDPGGSVTVVNARDEFGRELLIPPTINWSEEAKRGRCCKRQPKRQRDADLLLPSWMHG